MNVAAASWRQSSPLHLPALLLLLATACAPALAPAPVVTAPRHPDYLFPSVPPAFSRADLRNRQERGWQFLQAGDLAGARREFGAALKLNPAFYPADAGLAYVSLAAGDASNAAARFDQALRRSATYVPALVGRGDALAILGQAADAVASYEAALAADPSLGDVRRRVEALAFRSQQQSLQAARQAAEAGRLPDAVRLYERAIAASPDSSFLYRELAAVERAQGSQEAALAHLQRAVTLDPSDARAWTQMGELLEESGDYAGAARAYTSARGLEPGPEADARVARARRGAELARLPEEYRDIGTTERLTRGQLAALIGVRLAGLLQAIPRREAVVLTDARGHWAAAWIQAVVRAGVMEPYPNHAFAPGAVVRRLDLAQVATRVLNVLATRRPSLARQWQQVRPKVADVPQGHLGYAAVASVVAADVMRLIDGAFRPQLVVGGEEAMEVVRRLEVLAR